MNLMNMMVGMSQISLYVPEKPMILYTWNNGFLVAWRGRLIYPWPAKRLIDCYLESGCGVSNDAKITVSKLVSN